MSLKANITVEQGTDWVTTIDVKNDDGSNTVLSGYSGAGKIKKYYTSSTSVSFDISIVANTGQVILSLSSNTTSNMEAGQYVYDVKLTDSSNTISRLVEGLLTVTPGVT